MANDKRCTLPHDETDRDMPCWFCIHYGHISEPRASLDLRRVEQARRKAYAAAMGLRRRIRAGERFAR